MILYSENTVYRWPCRVSTGLNRGRDNEKLDKSGRVNQRQVVTDAMIRSWLRRPLRDQAAQLSNAVHLAKQGMGLAVRGRNFDP